MAAGVGLRSQGIGKGRVIVHGHGLPDRGMGSLQ
jgi:hypothetical protein